MTVCKKLFAVSILAIIGLQMYAECSGWSVVIKQQSMNICTASTIDLEMQVVNDTSATLDSCKYTWLIKKPSSSIFESVASTSKVGYLFNEVGSYSIKAAAQPNECTLFHESSPITITLYPTTTTGVITGDQTICYNSQPTILSHKTLPSGGDGNFTYQWQSKTSTDWTNIVSAVNTTYQPGALTETTLFRVQYSNGCTSVFSNEIEVSVLPNVTAPIITGIDTICYNNQPTLLYQTSFPTGGDGNFSYQWQSKTTGAWTNITGATSATYQPGKLSTTTHFQLVATTSCGSTISNDVEVYVRKDLTAPVILSTDETVCYGFSPSLITIPTLATCDIHDSLMYQWQVLTSGSWSDIVGATALTYQPEAITEAHQYRVIATSIKGCGQVISNVRTVNVYDKLQITTSGTDPLCYMTRGTIRVTAIGEGDSYTYQWQDSVAGVWSNVKNGNAPQYLTEPKIGGQYFYRCIVMPTLGCTQDTSTTIIVSVYDSINPGEILPMGADTICYGFIPDSISVTIPATGGDGNFTYQWLRRPNGATNFSYISGATGTIYSPAALNKTTEYQLEVTNACDVKYTNIVRIYVRDEIQAPVLIDHLDTICHNTIPDPIVTASPAVGGEDDSFTYQWLSSEDGINFTEIIGENDLIYQPDFLTKKTFYQLRATSTKMCGDILSNIVTVNVYDSLRISAENPDTLCYMTSATISINVTGGGDQFTYQWQELVSTNWQNIIGANAISYETQPKAHGDYYYRCIVSTIKCESYSRISPIIEVSIYDALTPGAIIGTDSTCFGHTPEESLRVDIPATGVDGKYTYQWQSKESGEWKHIVGENGTSYMPKPLMVSTDFRLQVASKCDTLFTNNIFIRVNPLPKTQTILGPNNVCYNQHETYSVEKLNSGYSYEWLIEYGKGELATEALNVTNVDVLWKTPNSKDSVILRVTNDITGCERDLKFGVSICNEQAPNRTIVVRKPNSNILVCKEDGNLIYQWGYTEKSSQEEFLIDDSNRRYVLLPHQFDNDTYDYWLSLRPSETSPCYSKSHYFPENDEMISSSSATVSVPSFVHGRIPIVIQNPDCDIVRCTIYTVSGELIGQYELGEESYLSTTLPIVLSSGMYVMHATIGEYVESIKLIAE